MQNTKNVKNTEKRESRENVFTMPYRPRQRSKIVNRISAHMRITGCEKFRQIRRPL